MVSILDTIAPRLAVVVRAREQVLPFQEAFADGRMDHDGGRGLDSCPFMEPLYAAWWRRGWRYGRMCLAIATAMESMEEAERNDAAGRRRYWWEDREG